MSKELESSGNLPSEDKVWREKGKDNCTFGRKCQRLKSLFFCFAFFVFFCILSAQDRPQVQPVRRTRIDLLYADRIDADQKVRPGVQVLMGSVKLRHDSMYMYCDSALIFEETNSVEAYSNIRVEQGDTLFIYGDYLYYDGQKQLAQLRDNVRMINRETVLTTDSLNYDRVANLGYYFDGGTLTDAENELTSEWGEYSPATKLAVFNRDVVLTNPKFTLVSDTLEYSTETKIATIVGPSDIDNNETHIYSELGYYDTTTEQAELLDRSVITHLGRKLTGDSLYYDRKTGIGEAFDHVVMNDTVNRNIFMGNYCLYNQLDQSAYATDSAVVVDYSQGDSLFMHADTLRMVTFFVNTDSAYREMRAYHKVRAFRNDVQAVCDSLVYNTKDSCLTMFRDPILWYGEEQLLGEQIKVYVKDSTINYAHIISQALAVEARDSVRFNQVSGKEMKAFFTDGELRQVDTDGNVRVIYYPIDEKDSTVLLMDYTESSKLKLRLEKGRLKDGTFIGKTTGTGYPLDQIPAGKEKLDSFAWFDNLRPKAKEDIFDWQEKDEASRLKSIQRQPSVSPRQMNIKRNKRR